MRPPLRCGTVRFGAEFRERIPRGLGAFGCMIGLSLECSCGGDGREEDRAKVGLPAMDLALAFPQATPASSFPPSGQDFFSCY